MPTTDRLRQTGGIGLVLMWGTFAALLVAPLVAMQFTTAVQWTTSDFAAAAILLIGFGAVVHTVARLVDHSLIRGVVILVVLAVGVMIWADGAVGIF